MISHHASSNLRSLALGLPFLLAACDLSGQDVNVDVDSMGATDGSDDVAASESDGETGGHPSDCTVTGGVDEESSATSDTPPVLAITLPAADATNDDGPMYTGYDDALMLYYYDVTLAADALDLEDGDLGAEIEWTTDQSSIQDPALGTGAELSVRLYSDECFGTTHAITATVIDTDGNTTSAVRLLNIWQLC